MSLPKVSVFAAFGVTPTVAIDGTPLRAVKHVQVTASRDCVPQVSVTFMADEVDLVLPAGVTVLRTGPSAEQFADQLDVRRLESEALAADDVSMGEGFARAVAVQAAEFDDR